MITHESENEMTEITYAHLNCFYCESLSGEAEDEAVRTPAARAAIDVREPVSQTRTPMRRTSRIRAQRRSTTASISTPKTT